MKLINRPISGNQLTKIWKVLPLILSLIAIGFSGAGFIRSLSTPKIGVIRSDELVYRYSGMKEAQEKYKGKQESWNHEVDSLDREFKAAFEKYRMEEGNLTQSQRRNRQEDLNLLQQSLAQHKANLAEKAAQEDRELTQGVLSQINQFVEEYGKEYGYDVVLGTDGTGNILHSEKYLDITEDVVKALNNSYRIADSR